MRRRIAISVILALAVLAAAVFVWSGQAALAFQQADDPQPGDVLVFGLPAAGNQPEPRTVENSDMIVYAGGKITSVDPGGCGHSGGPAQVPLQEAVLVDPGGLRSSRRVYIITVFQSGGGTDAVPPGTRLKDIVFDANCATPDGTAIKRWQGTVQ